VGLREMHTSQSSHRDCLCSSKCQFRVGTLSWKERTEFERRPCRVPVGDTLNIHGLIGFAIERFPFSGALAELRKIALLLPLVFGPAPKAF
jgi:hypothetical protein